MIRLDKFLADAGFGTRKEVKKYIKQGMVEVDGQLIRKDDFKFDEQASQVLFDGVLVEYQKYVYIMMNKPDGCVCANDDKRYPTVFEYLSEYSHRNLFTVGRLDVDTKGLLLITDDGNFAHHIISPKHMVDKIYECKLREKISEEMVKQLEAGIEFKDFKSDSAKVEVLGEYLIHLTIHEGKFHQVKRMLLSVGNEVVNLKRLKIGNLELDSSLAEGDYRLLTQAELNCLVNQ